MLVKTCVDVDFSIHPLAPTRTHPILTKPPRKNSIGPPNREHSHGFWDCFSYHPQEKGSDLIEGANPLVYIYIY
jgi:hypothetical protein